MLTGFGVDKIEMKQADFCLALFSSHVCNTSESHLSGAAAAPLDTAGANDLCSTGKD